MPRVIYTLRVSEDFESVPELERGIDHNDETYAVFLAEAGASLLSVASHGHLHTPYVDHVTLLTDAGEEIEVQG